MSAVYSIERIVWYALIVCQFSMVAALLFRGMWRWYPALAAYSLLVFIRSLIILSLGFRTWFLTEQLVWIAQCAVLYEAAKLLGREYPRLGQLGRIVAIAGGGAAFCVAVLSYSPAFSQLAKYVVAERIATGAQLGFLACVILAFRIIPTLIRRNVSRLIIVLTAYITTEVARYWAATDELGMHVSNAAGMAAEGACYLAWALLLTPAGERTASPALVSAGELDSLRKRSDGLINFARKLGR